MANTDAHAKALAVVSSTLNHWSKSYMDKESVIPQWKYYTEVTKHDSNPEILAVWSLPTAKEPIPRAFARVWFQYSQQATPPTLSYRFEMQSLIHLIPLATPSSIETRNIDAAAKHLGNPAKSIPQILKSKERVASSIQDGKLMKSISQPATPTAQEILEGWLQAAKKEDAVVETGSNLTYDRIFYRNGDATKPACGPFSDMIIPARVEAECWKSLGAKFVESNTIPTKPVAAKEAATEEDVAASKIQRMWRSRQSSHQPQMRSDDEAAPEEQEEQEVEANNDTVEPELEEADETPDAEPEADQEEALEYEQEDAEESQEPEPADDEDYEEPTPDTGLAEEEEATVEATE
ncbi:hypothetical protein SmJEL517_g01252 [Synchytrium microbalum]|uniref:Uncharacterized protein n=1 Tax=Synchytrium microbalum TaxID=1806994 RepID=A0A507CB56_9FUNG|nr:uncharacterized protein SmJEL517_g01252 [Synchytrium microbalum]TPX36588.1 hypothetical protein SmJEL517_g01252 [Synchytrium microbalum]